MARHTANTAPKPEPAAMVTEHTNEPAKPMPVETAVMKSPDDRTTGDATIESDPDVPPAKKYRVANAREVPVLYDGCHSKMWPGKIVDSACYDIEHLRRQGVQLEEVG